MELVLISIIYWYSLTVYGDFGCLSLGTYCSELALLSRSRMPKISGIELCQRLRRDNFSLPIPILTARDRMEDKITGLDAGADDYLVKPFGMEELLARLRALQRRAPTFQSDRLQLGNLRLDDGDNAIAISNPRGHERSVSLTAKEFQLLEYLMQNPDRILTHDQIRNRVWAFDSESVSKIDFSIAREFN